MFVIAASEASRTLVVAIAGINASGVVGPAATAWATRRANRQQFERDHRVKRQHDFRSLVDEAATLLGAGVTNLRIARESKQSGGDEPPEVREWASQVHLLRQRLLLRRPAADDVVTAYGDVLTALAEVPGAGDAKAYEQAVERYEARLESFLSSARSVLEAPVA
jgi:hypothetical protein